MVYAMHVDIQRGKMQVMDSDIQKVTGHASSAMVNAYDKSSRADNASKKVSLIS